jgi:sec-independent protein translocase protein TatA
VRVGVTELLVILLIVLVLFGSKKLPELADGMGKAIRNFKRGISTEDEDVTPPAATSSSTTSENKQVTPHTGTPDLREPSEAQRKG